MSIVPLFAVALGVQTEDLPSFDCSPVSTAFERAICGNPVWSQWNLRMAERYRALSQGLSPPAREALRLDQQWFLETQDARFQNRDVPHHIGDESQGLKARVAFLGSVATAPPVSLVGRWRNLVGEAVIKESAPGRLWLSIYSVEPVAGRWLCLDIAIEGPLEGQSVEGVPAIDPNHRLHAGLRDGYLVVEEESLSAESHSPHYCGHNGYVSGNYFRVE